MAVEVCARWIGRSARRCQNLGGYAAPFYNIEVRAGLARLLDLLSPRKLFTTRDISSCDSRGRVDRGQRALRLGA